MRDSHKRAFFKAILSIGCSFSLLVIPSKMQAQECCEDESCVQKWGTQSTALLLAGALLAGGAAIAVGTRDGSRGHQGDTGLTGSLGPEFVADDDQVLTFNIQGFSMSYAQPGTTVEISLLPYVVAPNGEVIEGTQISSNLNSGGNVISPVGVVIVNNPLFGNYNPGVKLTLINILDSNNDPTTLNSMGLSLQTIVNATRDGTLTYAFETDTVILSPPNVITAGMEAIISTDFVYGPNNIP